MQRLLHRRPRPSVELNVTEQLIMLFLFRFGAVPAEEIYAEIAAQRPLRRPEVLAALLRLEETGLVQADAQDDKGRRLYQATKLGQKLQGRVPPEPKSVTEFWL
ncbi:MAG: hypothetical protein ACE5IZ_10840 [Dehalococcoidia bacterium]